VPSAGGTGLGAKAGRNIVRVTIALPSLTAIEHVRYSPRLLCPDNPAAETAGKIEFAPGARTFSNGLSTHTRIREPSQTGYNGVTTRHSMRGDSLG
jgi:hypothetical protein